MSAKKDFWTVWVMMTLLTLFGQNTQNIYVCGAVTAVLLLGTLFSSQEPGENTPDLENYWQNRVNDSESRFRNSRATANQRENAMKDLFYSWQNLIFAQSGENDRVERARFEMGRNYYSSS
jgi:hypothetical protein